MLGASLIVGAYVVIREGCPIAMSIDDAEQAQVVCGTVAVDAFEFVLHREALRAIVELGSDVVAEMDALRSRSAD